MVVSKKSSKKENKKTSNQKNKSIYYVFYLLFFANIIVFTFFGYFIFRLFNSYSSSKDISQVAAYSIPSLKTKSSPDVTAVSFIVYDSLSRNIVMSKNQNIRLSPASSMKILTALVALDVYDLNNYLVASPAAPDDSKMGLFAGEQIDVKSLLYGLLLNSGNDAAKTLANNYPGGTKAFLISMNLKAKELGLSESNFIDPSGYMDNNYTTAFELARLASYAMKNKTIAEIVKTKKKLVYDKTGIIVHPLSNLNELLSDPNVIGVKTGFTNEAGGVLITDYVFEGRQLIIVVMKSEDRFLDTRKIIEEIKSDVYYSDVASD